METDSSVTHHRVNLVEGLAALLDFLRSYAELLGEFSLLLVCMRNELVERRVEETEYYRLAVHDLEGALHGCLDEWLKLREGCLSLLVGVAENHLAELCERSLGILSVEHVLETEETDAFRTE